MKNSKIFIFFKKNFIYFFVLFMLISRFTNLFRVNIVDGLSMYPTLKDGEVLLGSRFGKIERGDIVVAQREDYYVIKRVIGLPGESVKGNNGNVYINGQLLKEDYVVNNSYDNWEYVVGEDEYLLIGDNRPNSYDGRDYGPIKVKDIEQQIFFGVRK